MKLSEKDGKLFYKLWMPLLDFVNEKCEVENNIKNMANATELDPMVVKMVANVLWENICLIDQYLEECGTNISKEHHRIISGWKNCVAGHFIMERHLKQGTIFIGEDESVYQVQGIISSWEEMFPDMPLPLLVEATFIPFRDVIISDGLVMPYNIVIGKGMAKAFKNIYMNAKNNGTIIRRLPEYEGVKSTVRNKVQLNDKWKSLSELTSSCYKNMVGLENDKDCWDRTFKFFKEVVIEGREKDLSFARTLEEFDELTNYAYDIQGWMEDYLDEYEVGEDYEKLISICDEVLELFGWPEFDTPDIKTRKASALRGLGRNKEYVEFCKYWIGREHNNVVATAAMVNAFIDTEDYSEAEKLVNRFLVDKSYCTESNDIMFIAALRLYKAIGKSKEEKEIEAALDEYDRVLGDYLMGIDYR